MAVDRQRPGSRRPSRPRVHASAPNPFPTDAFRTKRNVRAQGHAARQGPATSTRKTFIQRARLARVIDPGSRDRSRHAAAPSRTWGRDPRGPARSTPTEAGHWRRERRWPRDPDPHGGPASSTRAKASTARAGGVHPPPAPTRVTDSAARAASSRCAEPELRGSQPPGRRGPQAPHEPAVRDREQDAAVVRVRLQLRRGPVPGRGGKPDPGL